MPNTKPLINGREHDWSSIQLLVGGVPIYGVTRINYDDNTVKENRYGAGSMPVSRGYGNYTAKCGFTLYASETRAIQQSAPNNKLQDIGPFDVVIQYLVGTSIITDVVRNCEFTGNSRSLNQGDTAIEVEHEIICSHIDWGKS